MKKLIVCVLTLAMLVSMFSVVGAAEGEPNTYLFTDATCVQGADNQVLLLEADAIMAWRAAKSITITGKLETKGSTWTNGEFIINGGEGSYGWQSVTIGGSSSGAKFVYDLASDGYTFSVTIDEIGDYTIAEVLESAAASWWGQIKVVSYWENFTVESLTFNLGDVEEDENEGEDEGVLVKGPGNGTLPLSAISAYDTIELVLQATDETDTRPGWGLGGFADSGWALISGIESITSTGVATQKHAFKVADIVAAYEAIGLEEVYFNIYENNGFTLAEVRGYVAEEEEALEPNVIYKQMAENENGSYNVRFVQMITEEEAQTYSAVTYTVSYNGKVKATVPGDECYAAISAAGETITAPEGYVFVACVVKNVPEAFSYDLLTCDMEFTPVAAQ